VCSDLGCGTGRHSVPLALMGCEVVGVDLSEKVLAVARELAASHRAEVIFERRDMRDVGEIGKGFDACISMYTVFGYFDAGEDARVLRGIREVLAPEGALLLDLTNFPFVLRSAGTPTWREGERAVTREVQRYQPLTGVLVTERTLFRKEGGVVKLPDSRVRAWAPHEVAALLESTGFQIVELFGDLEGGRFEWDRSLRQVFLAKVADGSSSMCPG